VENPARFSRVGERRSAIALVKNIFEDLYEKLDWKPS